MNYEYERLAERTLLMLDKIATNIDNLVTVVEASNKTQEKIERYLCRIEEYGLNVNTKREL